jgi:hypothetical protein
MDTKTRKSIKPWIRFYIQAYNILFHEGDKVFQELIENPDGKLEAFSITLLYRKMLELAHGQMSLIKNNSFITIKSLNREAWETKLYLSFIEEEDSEERGLNYQIHGILEKIEYLETFLPDHKTFKIYQEGLEKQNLQKLEPSPEKTKEVQDEIQRLKVILDTPPLKDPYHKNFYEKKPRNWYNIKSKKINSLKDLSSYLDQEIIYHTLYRNYSEYTHGYNLIKPDIVQTSLLDGNIEFFESPSPPFDIARDFLFFQTMFMESTISSLKTIGLERKRLDLKIYQRIRDHFNSNNIRPGVEFIDNKRLIKFPSKKKK